MSALTLPTDGPSRLPLELVIDILKYLSVYDLRHVAKVSRLFREVVKHIPKFSVALIFTQPQRVMLACDAFADAIAERLPVALTLDLTAAPQQAVIAVCSMLPSIFPYLVELNATVPKRRRTSFDTILCAPATRLRSFSLHHDHAQYTIPFAIPLPTDIFNGVAPNLQCLALFNVAFPLLTSTALSRIHRLELHFTFGTPDVELYQHFPAVRSLLIYFPYSYGPPWGVPQFRIKCRGLSLNMLEVHDGPIASVIDQISQDLPISTIPLVVHGGQGAVSPEIWQGLNGPFSLRIGHHGSELVTALRMQDSGTCRVIKLSRSPPVIPPMIFNVFKLHLDIKTVSEVIIAAAPSGLPALQTLEIDVQLSHPQSAAQNLCLDQDSASPPLPIVTCAKLFIVCIYNPGMTAGTGEALHYAAAFTNPDGRQPRLQLIGSFEDDAITELLKSFSEVSINETQQSTNLEWEGFGPYS